VRQNTAQFLELGETRSEGYVLNLRSARYIDFCSNSRNPRKIAFCKPVERYYAATYSLTAYREIPLFKKALTVTNLYLLTLQLEVEVRLIAFAGSCILLRTPPHSFGTKRPSLSTTPKPRVAGDLEPRGSFYWVRTYLTDHRMLLDWRVGWLAPAVGAVVFLIWIGLNRFTSAAPDVMPCIAGPPRLR